MYEVTFVGKTHSLTPNLPFLNPDLRQWAMRLEEFHRNNINLERYERNLVARRMSVFTGTSSNNKLLPVPQNHQLSSAR